MLAAFNTLFIGKAALQIVVTITNSLLDVVPADVEDAAGHDDAFLAQLCSAKSDLRRDLSTEQEVGP